jgi:hypothetical protein
MEEIRDTTKKTLINTNAKNKYVKSLMKQKETVVPVEVVVTEQGPAPVANDGARCEMATLKKTRKKYE